MSDNIKLGAARLSFWRANPISWIEECLHDPETGRAFVLTEAERNFLSFAFKLTADSQLLYPELVFGAIKKSGKTTLAAIIMLTMILLFGGRFSEGYCLANDSEQAQSRVFAIIKRIIAASPLLKPEAKITADKIIFPKFFDATIISLASDAASAAGGNPTISCFDEGWGYQSERARRLFDEMVISPARKISCRLSVSYAGWSNESLMLEELYKRGMQLPKSGHHLRAAPGMLFAWHHLPISPWQDEAWLEQMRRDLRPSQYLRMIENRWITSKARSSRRWLMTAASIPTPRRSTPIRMLPINLGIDASTKHDQSAVVATCFDKKSKQARLVTHRTFQPTPTEPLNFKDTIERTVLDLSKRFKVRRVLYDPYQMAATAQELTKAGVKMEEYPQSSPNLTQASQNLWELINSQALVVYPDPDLKLAISRAVAVETAARLADQQTNRIATRSM